MSVQYIPPYTPLLYNKTGVCRGIPIFLIFAPKHRLWVLVRTASIKKKNLRLLHGQVFVMKCQTLCKDVHLIRVVRSHIHHKVFSRNGFLSE